MKIVYLIFILFALFQGCNNIHFDEKHTSDSENDEIRADHFLFEYVNTELFEMNSSFSKSGDKFYYSIADPYQNYNAIVSIERKGNKWNKPKIVSFSGTYSDFDPFLTYDENRIYFCSRRPKDKNDQTQDANIWFVTKENNIWSEAQILNSNINSEFDEYYVSISKNGVIYFTSTRSGGVGLWDIYYSNMENDLVNNIGEPINTEYREWDPFISADASLIVFTSDRPKGFGGGDLYVSFKNKEGEWGIPQNLGDKINTSDYEYCPYISRDNKYLYFSRFGGESVDFKTKERKTYQDFTNKLRSTENGLGNIYRIRLDELEVFN